MTQNNWAVKSSYMTKGVSRHTLAPMHQLASHHYLAGRMNEAIDASDATALHGMGQIDLTEGQTKSALDALEKASVFKDDSQIVKLTSTKHAPVKGGKVIVRVLNPEKIAA